MSIQTCYKRERLIHYKVPATIIRALFYLVQFPSHVGRIL